MTRAGIFLLVLGILQMAGEVLRLPVLKGVGAATDASPAPRVFSSVHGLETFSTHFEIEWTDTAGIPHSTLITSERYSGLRGPYNRRNVYGAVLAYGPVLQADSRTRAMFDSVAHYALCGDAPLLAELGIPPQGLAGHVRIRLQTRPGSQTDDLPLVLSPSCP
jgi:hypothetical protein